MGTEESFDNNAFACERVNNLLNSVTNIVSILRETNIPFPFIKGESEIQLKNHSDNSMLPITVSIKVKLMGGMTLLEIENLLSEKIPPELYDELRNNSRVQLIENPYNRSKEYHTIIDIDCTVNC
ncbi:hypothetical protein KC669_03820 [Candidatus Dojkabacteria bacterium]|uniref:Uncharacterized protein n=1 Tax=Candidatus Dojkabacteria bacterium TaxID=2099670 RepID=A0A955LBH7_9BACT|nr:hypothetical protein [Candidatus Dojkabacteria bacterium]